MKIRLGSTPSIAAAVRRVVPAAPRGVVPGRVVRPPPVIVPHLPPVHFFAEATVDAGGEATLRSEALSNRTGESINIHEIRMMAHGNVQATLSEVDLGAFIRIRLAFNGRPITHGFIPMWLLGKIEQYRCQVAAGTESNAVYVWRLSRPWSIPPGGAIEAQIQHGSGVRFPALVGIGLAGQYAASRPTTSIVPYAAAYVSKSFGYSDVGFDESPEQDLANATKRSLNVDRIIGRVSVTRSAGSNPTAYINDILDQGPASLMRLRILTSGNLPIIRRYASPAAVFGYSRALDISHTLAAGEFYRVGVQKIAGAALTTAFTTWEAQMNVSIVGSREESI